MSRTGPPRTFPWNFTHSYRTAPSGVKVFGCTPYLGRVPMKQLNMFHASSHRRLISGSALQRSEHQMSRHLAITRYPLCHPTPGHVALLQIVGCHQTLCSMIARMLYCARSICYGSSSSCDFPKVSFLDSVCAASIVRMRYQSNTSRISSNHRIYRA